MPPMPSNTAQFNGEKEKKMELGNYVVVNWDESVNLRRGGIGKGADRHARTLF